MMCDIQEAEKPSEWVRLAQEAEEEERWLDAHHYWLEGSMACSENKKRAKRMQLSAFRIFEKWQNSC